ncbi:hypothetical protein IKF34_02290 [Candidatus Saccharibacteria bacterium]|nr:hypothetical protein [Candidatus Saccharibacteria bacterium]
MKFEGVKEVSRALAEFDFSGVLGRVVILIGLPDDNCLDEVVDIDLYEDGRPNSAANWSEEEWFVFINGIAKSIQDSALEEYGELSLMNPYVQICFARGDSEIPEFMYIDYDDNYDYVCELEVCGLNDDGGVELNVSMAVGFRPNVGEEGTIPTFKSADEVIDYVCSRSRLLPEDFGRIRS